MSFYESVWSIRGVGRQRKGTHDVNTVTTHEILNNKKVSESLRMMFTQSSLYIVLNLIF